MANTVIKVENLSKQYRLGNVGLGSLGADVNRWWQTRILGNDDPYLKIGEENNREVIGKSEYVWALRDINFEVQQGEVLGIIGRNGAGKSTLLKILSRTTGPTTGSIKIKGRVASLLEVGTGFHPELTGRENIFLNGAILGMTKDEIRRKFDEIVDFAGVERYVDTPVKRYSSGMYVRLAFAVAAHLEPEILIVDEVLAVGDAEFQKKALGKMKEVSEGQGRTVLFVSHNMGAVINLCSKSILLQNGALKALGNAKDVIAQYKRGDKKNGKLWSAESNRAEAHFSFLKINLSGEEPNLILSINFGVEASVYHKDVFVAFNINNSLGTPIMQAIPITTPFIGFKKGVQSFQCHIELNGLVPDSYIVSAWMGEDYHYTLDWQKEILSFEIESSPIRGRTLQHSHSNGFIIPKSVIIQLKNEELPGK